jgi:GDPmannose 4,6-dehydratase
MAFAEVGITLTLKENKKNETATVAACSNPLYQIAIGTVVLRVDPEYYRPTEVDLLIGDPTKSKHSGMETTV